MTSDQPDPATLRDRLRQQLAAPAADAETVRRRTAARQALDARPGSRTPVDLRAWANRQRAARREG
jgi:hypothetical protein